MLSFINVASGSKGNATLIFDENTLIQIDMGVSLKCVKEGLSLINKDFSDIAALFITHEHNDHVKGLGLYHKKIKTYAGRDTLNEDYIPIDLPAVIEIGTLSIIPLPTSHDANNPMGFLIESKDRRLGFITDTGYLDKESIKLLYDCDYLYFESNHDRKMLMDSSRPLILKNRIKSKHGHLSNAKSGTYLAKLIGPRTKQIVLAHLSEECNTPEKALETVKDKLRGAGIRFDHIEIICAKQYEMTLGGDK